MWRGLKPAPHIFLQDPEKAWNYEKPKNDTPAAFALFLYSFVSLRLIGLGDLFVGDFRV